ncbi:hypothetical protein Agau_C102167 [Agrobacterium tumefaciens F2]|nr:hypothetical protein Agau_C102167 [Agrobacterium tumefaciens F2]
MAFSPSGNAEKMTEAVMRHIFQDRKTGPTCGQGPFKTSGFVIVENETKAKAFLSLGRYKCGAGGRHVSALIPVPVTGIQSTRLSRGGKDSFQPKDLVWLDLCDKHRDEVGWRFAPAGNVFRDDRNVKTLQFSTLNRSFPILP